MYTDWEIPDDNPRTEIVYPGSASIVTNEMLALATRMRDEVRAIKMGSREGLDIIVQDIRLRGHRIETSDGVVYAVRHRPSATQVGFFLPLMPQVEVVRAATVCSVRQARVRAVPA